MYLKMKRHFSLQLVHSVSHCNMHLVCIQSQVLLSLFSFLFLFMQYVGTVKALCSFHKVFPFIAQSWNGNNMRGKVSFTNARKRKVYKVKSFDLKNTKFKVQKSTASSSFWIPGTNFQMQIFSFKKTTSPTNNKKTPQPPSNKTNLKQNKQSSQMSF